MISHEIRYIFRSLFLTIWLKHFVCNLIPGNLRTLCVHTIRAQCSAAYSVHCTLLPCYSIFKFHHWHFSGSEYVAIDVTCKHTCYIFLHRRPATQSRWWSAIAALSDIFSLRNNFSIFSSVIAIYLLSKSFLSAKQSSQLLLIGETTYTNQWPQHNCFVLKH